MADHRRFHSEYQIDHFVIGKFGETPYSQYCQALRELESREWALKQEVLELQRLEIERKNLDPHSVFFEVDLAQAEIRRSQLERIIKDRERELGHVFCIARALKKELGEIDYAKRSELEAEAWEEKTKAKAALECASSGYLSPATLEAVASLKSESREMVLAFAHPNNRESLLDYIASGKQGGAPKAIKFEDPKTIRGVLCP
jgi:hypothetical protein